MKRRKKRLTTRKRSALGWITALVLVVTAGHLSGACSARSGAGELLRPDGVAVPPCGALRGEPAGSAAVGRGARRHPGRGPFFLGQGLADPGFLRAGPGTGAALLCGAQ